VCKLTIKEISCKLKNNPLMLHINPIGLFRLERDNAQRFSRFNSILNSIQSNGGNIAIPSYSYSYAKNEIYDMENTPSDLDSISEYLRVNNTTKRTADANFSYLLFGDFFSDRHFKVSNYSSFGEGSLIEDVFNKDGYLGAIGGALEYLTEIHFLERKLNINYRFDKDFHGVSIDRNSYKTSNKITYFCRDLDSSYLPSFVRLKNDIRDEGLVKTWSASEFNLKIEVIKIRELFNFIEEKLLVDEKYLQKYENVQN
jgi:aminoglycoside 3-N-acetyltransferase